MKKILLCLTAVYALASSELHAQGRMVTGRVTSAEDGAALPGVNIVLKGTTSGTVSDAEGKYSLSVPSQGGLLIFTFIGLVSQEVDVAGREVVDVVMHQDVRQLTEIVVTANAIEREKREIGYAVSTVAGDEITKAREVGFVNSLSGKVAGVRVTQQSGTLGGSSKVIIRGANSLGGTSEPLFVVDGIPISNSSFVGTRNEIIGGGVDAGNRASDINSDDIESISVLKGASATALYGSRAANGAIIITTKRGSKSKKSFVEVNSSVRFDNALRLPDFQNEYAQGNFGEYSPIYTNGWGPKISDVQGQQFPNYLGEDVELRAYPNNVKDFYETGHTLMNSVAFSDANETSDFRLAYSNTRQTGIVPNSELERNNITLNAGMKFANKFSARTSFTYVRTARDGITGQGSNNPNIISSIINSLPRNMDSKALKNHVYDGVAKQAIAIDGTRNAVNNPYWVTQNNGQTNRVERLYGNFTVEYDPFEWLNFTGRVGTDIISDYRRFISRKGTLGDLNGSFDTYEISNRDVTSDFMATFKKKITNDIKFTGLIGHNVYQRAVRRGRVESKNLNIDGLYTYTNAQVNTPTNNSNQKRIVGVYSNLGFSYKDYLFLDITARNDWSSTLPSNNNSYFYPGVSTSFILTDAVPSLSTDVLSFVKLRANIANVGSDTDPYQLQFTFDPLSTQYGQYGLGTTYPYGGLLAFAGSDILPPLNLKPQNQVSYEFGTEMQFMNGRVSLDFSYYNTSTLSQIIRVSVPPSTGFAYQTSNAGTISNRGIEILLGANILGDREGINWNVDVNFSKNKQTLEKLDPSVNLYLLTSGFSGIQIQVARGQEFGLYGGGWARDPDGNIIINATTGLRQTTTNKRLGNIFPDWTMGINNTISYKGIALSFLVDIRQGGVLYSGTTQALRASGLAKETLANRDGIFVDKGVNDNGDGTYSPNTTPVESMQQFWTVYSGGSNSESSTFDGSYIKLREARLSYALPSSLLSKTPFGSVSIGIEGRNLWLIKSKVPHVDPEANFFGASLIGEGVEFNSIPSTRTIGANLRFTF